MSHMRIGLNVHVSLQFQIMHLYDYVIMMMIAFITIKRGIVPVIEGRCAQIACFRFEIIGGLCSHQLLFLERKNMLKKKTVGPRSHPTFYGMYTHVYFVHIFAVSSYVIFRKRAL